MFDDYRTAAVIVTKGFSENLTKAVDSCVNQTLPPAHIFIVDVDPEDNILDEVVKAANQGIAENEIHTNIILFQADGEKTFGGAVNALIHSDFFSDDIKYIWALHDDTTVSPDSLQSQIDEASTSETVGVVGAKQIDASSGILLNVGYTSTQTGKRVRIIGKDEIDQDQYDSIQDVLAVSLNAALIKVDVLESIGGINPDLSLYHDSLDFCRRVHLHSRRVVVAKNAKAFHLRARYDAQNFFQIQRSSMIYRLGAIPLWALCFAWAFFFTTAFIPAIKQLYSGKRGAASIFGGTYAGLFSFVRIYKARRLNSLAKVVRRHNLKKLYASSTDIKLLRKDERLEQAAKLWEDFQPTLLQTGVLKELAKKRRLAFWCLVTMLVALTLIRFAGSFALIASGGHFISLDLPSSTATPFEALRSATSGYTFSGFGVDAPVNPVVLPVALLSIIFLSVQNALNFIILSAILFAGISAFAASGAATRNNSARITAAIIWVSLPSFTLAMNTGRVGAVLAHILLPLVPLLIARGLGKASTDLNIGMPPLGYNFALLGIVVGFLLASSPNLTPIVVLIFLIAGVKNRRFIFALLPAIFMNIWLWLWVLFNIGHGSLQIFLGDLSLSYGATSKNVFSVVFGDSQIADPATFIGVLVILASALFLLIARENRKLLITRLAWVFSVACIICACIAEEISNANPSTFVSAAFLGFIVTILIFVRERVAFKRRALVAYSVVGILILAISTCSLVFARYSELQVVEDYALPAVAGKIGSNDGGHILVLQVDRENNATYSVLASRSNDFIYNSDAARIMNESSGVGEDDLALREVVAHILAAPYAEAGEDLADLGIGGIFVPQTQDEMQIASHDKLLNTLDSAGSMVRVIEGSERGFWRVESDSPVVWEHFDIASPANEVIRVVEVSLMTLCLFGFFVLSLPIRKRRVIKYAT
jgi:GT2 family glycosyltransferase